MQQTSLSGWERRAPTASVLEPDGMRRFDRGSWLVLALALFLLSVGTVQFIYRLTFPTLGWTIDELSGTGNVVFVDSPLGLPSPLRAGDVWLTLEGQPVSRALHLRPDSGVVYRAGERLSIGVERDGARLEFAVPLGHWNVQAVLSALGQSLRYEYPTLVGFLVAFLVFYLRPRLVAARLLFLFYVAQFLIFLSRSVEAEAGFAVADGVSRLSYLLTLFFGSLSYLLLLAPLLLHLCLSFPDTKPLLRRFPWLLMLAYLLPWLALAGFMASGTLYASGRTLLFVLTALYSLVSSAVFVHTFMTAQDPLRRAQVRWVAFGFVVLGVSGLAWIVAELGWLEHPLLSALATFPATLALTLCLALALLRFRLFDIDVILNRTLVYTALTAAVVLLYVVVVGSFGALLGTQDNVVFSLVGTGLVAVLFQPLREFLQRFVNRLMYGQRDEPYALLMRLSRQIGSVKEPEAMLPELAHTVAETLKLPYVGFFLYAEGGASEAVSEVGSAVAGPVVLSLKHHGETFGELRLGPHSGGFTPKELELLQAIAQQASVAAYTVRQTRALRRSHERLISAREAERLRLRRDLHDGLGPTLAGLNLQLAALKSLTDEPARVREGLTEVQQELRRTAGEVRRIVHDLRPPSLDDLGLTGALAQLVQGMTSLATCVSLELPNLPPLPPATEVALYRVAQEGLSNALKHARAAHVQLTLSLGETLSLVVSDDGDGFPENYRAGVGLGSMRERAEALGGQLEVRSEPGTGTTVHFEVPFARGGDP